MSDQYISKQELVRILYDVGNRYVFYSDNSMGFLGYGEGPDHEIEKYLSRYIDHKVSQGVRNILYNLATEIEIAPSGELCLLCKDANPIEDEQS
jgi:hypothetical protein